MLYKQHKFVGDNILVGKDISLPPEVEGSGRIAFSQRENIEFTSRAFFEELKRYNATIAELGLDEFRDYVEHGSLETDVQRTFGDINGWAGDHAKLYPPDGKEKTFEELNVRLQVVSNRKDIPYFRLALGNWDHFMPMSYELWKRFHEQALRLAKEFADSDSDVPAFKQVSDPINMTEALVFDLDTSDLAKSLLLDAYGCHFLQDSFVAGHLRTPRLLFGNDFDAFHSKFMHDEDNELRIQGCSKEGNQFKLIGENSVLDDFAVPINLEADYDLKVLLKNVTEAVATSVQQVFDVAYKVREKSDIELDEVGRKVPRIDIYWRELAENRSRRWALEIWPRLTNGKPHKPMYKFHANYDEQERKFKDPILIKRTYNGSWRREGLIDVDFFTPGRDLAWWLPDTPQGKITVP